MARDFNSTMLSFLARCCCKMNANEAPCGSFRINFGSFSEHLLFADATTGSSKSVETRETGSSFALNSSLTMCRICFPSRNFI